MWKDRCFLQKFYSLENMVLSKIPKDYPYIIIFLGEC